MRSTQWPPYLGRINAPGSDVGPFGVFRDEPRSLGIGQHVLPLLAIAFVRPDAMIEGCWLPPDLISVARRSLESSDGFADADRLRDDHDQVRMVRHREEQERLPELQLSQVFSRIDQASPSGLACELIHAAASAAKGKENRITASRPRWPIMPRDISIW